MKKLVFMAVIVFMAAILSNCKKEDPVKPEELSMVPSVADLESHLQSLDEYFAELSKGFKEHMLEISQSGIMPNRECMDTVRVPQDSPTIQGAIDIVCDHGYMIVNPGTYDEGQINVYKPNLKIFANGTVTVNGYFVFLSENGYNSDNCRLEGFNIVIPCFRHAIIAWLGANGCEIKRNNITGSCYSVGGMRLNNCNGWKIDRNLISHVHEGVQYHNCNNNIFTNNVISDFIDGGIGSSEFGSYGNDNLIKGNTIKDPAAVYHSSWGIICYGDNNIVRDNHVRGCWWGIGFWSVTNGGQIGPGNILNDNIYHGILCGGGNNTVCKNVCNNCGRGITVYQDNNQIGQDNEFNSCEDYGIFVVGSNNNIFRNTALSNGLCDIRDIGTNNTFTNNTYGTFCY